jgi:hypothetical protein
MLRPIRFHCVGVWISVGLFFIRVLDYIYICGIKKSELCRTLQIVTIA